MSWCLNLFNEHFNCMQIWFQAKKSSNFRHSWKDCLGMPLIATIVSYDLWSIQAIFNAFYNILSHTTLTTLCLFDEDANAWKWSQASLAWCVLEHGHQWTEATTYLHHELQHGCSYSHFRIHGLGLTHVLSLKVVHSIMIVLNMYKKTFHKAHKT
jgi:hypothetical protein